MNFLESLIKKKNLPQYFVIIMNRLALSSQSAISSLDGLDLIAALEAFEGLVKQIGGSPEDPDNIIILNHIYDIVKNRDSHKYIIPLGIKMIMIGKFLCSSFFLYVNFLFFETDLQKTAIVINKKPTEKRPKDVDEEMLENWKLCLLNKLNSIVSDENRSEEILLVENEDGWNLACPLCDKVFRVIGIDGLFIPSNLYNHVRLNHNNTTTLLDNATTSQTDTISLTNTLATSSTTSTLTSSSSQASVVEPESRRSKRPFVRTPNYASVSRKKIIKK